VLAGRQQREGLSAATKVRTSSSAALLLLT
jgi:hypothetical protein